MSINKLLNWIDKNWEPIAYFCTIVLLGMSAIVIILYCTGCGELTHPMTEFSFEKTIEQLDTPAKLETWLHDYTEYEADRDFSQEWMEPRDFFRRKKGDCEDYARFVSRVLDTHGYANAIICIYGEDYAHAVVMFEDGEEYDIFSNEEIYDVDVIDVREVCSYLCEEWKVYTVYPEVNKGITR